MNNSIHISPVIAGTMKWGVRGVNFSTQDYLTVIKSCIEYGVTSFDHADIYGHYTGEEAFGKALLLQPSLREQIQIVTKCGIKLVTPSRPEHAIKYYDTSKQHIIQSVENSLKNFHTHYIDIFLLHRPDPLMNPYEIAEAFTTLQQQGKVLHFGVSNFNASQSELIHSFFPIKANQLEISIVNLLALTDGSLDHCIKEKIIPMAWSPLGGSKFFNVDNEQNKKIMAVANYLGEKYDVFADQILLAWLFKHPAGIKPVLGSVKIERIKRAFESSKISITAEEWFMLWRASTGKEVD